VSHIYPAQFATPSQKDSAPKVHILGDDAKSRFIAHQLSSLQNSVELLSWHNVSRYTKFGLSYTNILQRPKGEKEYVAEPNRANCEHKNARDSNELIDNLVVVGAGNQAVLAMESVKHRVDEQTTVLLISDGLGVLEDVRQKVFNGETHPNTPRRFLLGHMSHHLSLSRNHNAVKVGRRGTLMMTDGGHIRYGQAERNVPKAGMVPRAKSGELEAAMQQVGANASVYEYDRWLRFKLPSVMFDAVVEPTCAILDLPYADLLENPSAKHLMRTLQAEISNLMRELPEIGNSRIIQEYFDEDRLWMELRRAIIHKRDQPSRLAVLMKQGLPTDVDYLHGYFIRRAKVRNVDVRTSVLVRTLIKAKHSKLKARRNSRVPFQESSIPPGEDLFKYRTASALGSDADPYAE
jgi:cytochrome b translational activator protein CBS2